jgi:hypothetical protein
VGVGFNWRHTEASGILYRSRPGSLVPDTTFGVKETLIAAAGRGRFR